MEKKNIISLAGELASGKGTVSKLLSEELNYTIYRNGEYVRKLAKDKGLDITSFNEYLNDHPEIDRQIEKSASEYAKEHDNFIIDARLGWYAVPESFKVYLTIDKNLLVLKNKNLIWKDVIKWKMLDILICMVLEKKIYLIMI